MRAQLQCRGRCLRIGRAGFFEPGGRFGRVLLQQRQLTQCRHRVGIVLVFLEEGREARLGSVRLFLLHVQARQIGHGRQERRLQLHRFLERRACRRILALDHIHGALELLHLRAVRLLLFERRHGGLGAVVALHAHLGLHQCHRGLERFRIERRGRFEFAQATGLVALRQARQAKRGTHGGSLRRQRGSLLEVAAGLVEVTHLHVRLARQGQQLRILRRVLQGWRQGCGGIGWLRIAQLRLGQQLACIDIVRIALQVFAQMLLGLLGAAQIQLGCAGQQDAWLVIGRDLEDFGQRVFRCRVFTLRELEQGAGVHHQQAARRILFCCLDFDLGRIELAARDLDVRLFNMGAAMIRFQLERLVIRRQGFVGLVHHAQHRAAHHVGFGIFRILGHSVLDITLCCFAVAFGGGHARHAHQGLARVGIGCQRSGVGLLRFFRLAAAQQRVSAQAQQWGRTGRRFGRDLGQHFLELALLRQRLAEQRQHARRRDVQRTGTAEFFFSRHGITGRQLQGTQRHARFAIFRAVCHGILQLDQRRLDIALFLIVSGFGQQGLGRLGAVATGQAGSKDGAGQQGGKSKLGSVARHVGFLRQWSSLFRQIAKFLNNK